MTDLWRARALRYTLIYLLLACVLVGLRYQTRDVRPDLLALREQRETLAQKKLALQLEVQGRTSSARIRDWAIANGMVPFTRSAKETASFAALPAPATIPPARPLEVTTRWK